MLARQTLVHWYVCKQLTHEYVFNRWRCVSLEEKAHPRDPWWRNLPTTPYMLNTASKAGREVEPAKGEDLCPCMVNTRGVVLVQLWLKDLPRDHCVSYALTIVNVSRA